MDYKHKSYRIAVLGAEGVGKTSLTMGDSNHIYKQYNPTVEDSFITLKTIHDTKHCIEILDTAGQEEYASLRDNWIRQSDGVVLVYDVTSRASFTSLEQLIEQVMQVKWDPEDSVASRPSRLPIMIVGNKMDLLKRRRVRNTEGLAFAKKHGCMFVETSAWSTHNNVDKAFCDVVKILLSLTPQSSNALAHQGWLGEPIFSFIKSIVAAVLSCN
ncbi:putative small G-protein Ras2 [Xylaria arbuscula]|nr:putative small G-protein Ras2 [Xylaria arbuscula]